jgi:L-fuculose-phosphate aldolase
MTNGGTKVDKNLVDQVVGAAARVVASGAISANGHGNVSLRVPGADEMYFTSAPSLRGLGPEGVVRVGLDGTLLEGQLPPIQGAVVAMHTAMYQDDPEVGCVVHTHSPYATAFAVANRSIDCWIEALAMFGLADGVPVAGYAPRGSEASIANIRRAVRPGVPAVLLANHGVLVFHRTPELAVLVGGVVEEAAQAAINALALGGPVEIPADMRAAAFQRAMAFDTAGTKTA